MREVTVEIAALHGRLRSYEIFIAYLLANTVPQEKISALEGLSALLGPQLDDSTKYREAITSESRDAISRILGIANQLSSPGKSQNP